MKLKSSLILILTLLMSITANAYDAEINGIYYNFYYNEATVTYKEYESYPNYNFISLIIRVPLLFPNLSHIMIKHIG